MILVHRLFVVAMVVDGAVEVGLVPKLLRCFESSALETVLR